MDQRQGSHRSALPVLLLLAAAAAPAAAQEGGAPPPAPPPEALVPGGPPKTNPARVPGTIDTVFRAPTGEDWKRPCLLTFQRTWEDAQAVARETGRAILICVNMDGEPASEHYAGVRYRSPEVAPLYEPYVAVIASVYRHSPRDHDDAGSRVLCPRFGSVTCGEHIAIEPILYEKYFEGQRIAPRHIMIEPGKGETFDVFYANDVVSVLDTLREGIATRPGTPKVVVRGDRPVVERVASRDVKDREAVEAAYRDGDAALRKALIDAAAKHPDAAPLDLLRLAVFGLDVDLGAQARRALAGSRSPAATGLIADALRAPMDEKDRGALIDTLGRLGKSSPRARWLAVVHRGLSGKSEAVDVGAWGAGSTYPAPAPGGVAAGPAAGPAPAAPAAAPIPVEAAERLAVAEELLSEAMEGFGADPGAPSPTRTGAKLLLEDARRAALDAERLGGKGWRSDAVVALAAYYAGGFPEAYARAEASVRAVPPGDAGWMSMAVLTVFAEGRWKSIKKAVTEKREWPPQWLTDLNAAYSVLRNHPRATDARLVWYHDLLEWLSVDEQASAVLDDALARFPDSELVHARLRKRLLEKRNADALEAAYDGMLRGKEGRPALQHFAGVASVAAAENHARERRLDPGIAAYGRAVERFERAAAGDPSRREEVDRSVALALAGRARLHFLKRDDGAAAADVVASLGRGPGSAGDADGLGFTPGDTARTLLARLKERGQADLAAGIEKALAAIDPRLLPGERD